MARRKLLQTMGAGAAAIVAAGGLAARDALTSGGSAVEAADGQALVLEQANAAASTTLQPDGAATPGVLFQYTAGLRGLGPVSNEIAAVGAGFLALV